MEVSRVKREPIALLTLKAVLLAFIPTPTTSTYTHIPYTYNDKLYHVYFNNGYVTLTRVG